jgi:hypothetical protein
MSKSLNVLHKDYILCKFVYMDLDVQTSRQRERKQILFKQAVQQQCFFTAAQSQEAGYSNRLRHHHKTQGNREEHGWGLYRLTYFPHGQDEDLVRLTLWSRNKSGPPQAVVSHETSLRLYELSDVLPDKYHLTVPAGFHKELPDDVILHHARLEPQDIQMREGFSVTTPLLTLIDVAKGNSDLEEFDLAAQAGSGVWSGAKRKTCGYAGGISKKVSNDYSRRGSAVNDTTPATSPLPKTRTGQIDFTFAEPGLPQIRVTWLQHVYKTVIGLAQL